MDSGVIHVGEIDIGGLPEDALTTFRNRHVGFVFQFHHLLPEFTALENAEMPLRIARVRSLDARARAMAVLERLGLADRRTHRPTMLSGGEQQRVAVARALVTEPSVLLADEPTGNLDERTAEALHALLREMHRERQLSSVIATHNMQLARSCDRILRLEGGHLVQA
jgi:lipoprotein-releasing system ATP-binding protein